MNHAPVATCYKEGVARSGMTAEEKLRNPRPGSKIEAAQRYGVDLTLLIESLRLTPEERLRDLQRVMEDFEALREAGRKK